MNRRRRLSSAVLVSVLATVAFAPPVLATVAPARAAGGEPAAAQGVTVPVPAAAPSQAPASARACTVQFDGFTAVATDCPRPCNAEAWDGPLLHASNACERSIWVGQLFEAPDGRTYRTPCFELPSGATLALPEPGLASARRREVHVGTTPGPGWPRSGFRLDCYPARTPVEEDVWWLDERWLATVHEGPLGPDAHRPAAAPER